MPLEDYQMLERVGQGAQGTVYRAIHTLTQKTVAMKRIPVAGLSEAEKATALQEVRVLSTLKHDPCPYVMGYLESFIDAKAKDLCLILEWSSEGTLQDAIDAHNARWQENHTKQYAVVEQPPMRGFGGDLPNASFRAPNSKGSTAAASPTAYPPSVLTEGEVWRAFLSVVCALFHVHCQNILHRDVKMANVFLHSSNSGDPSVAAGPASPKNASKATAVAATSSGKVAPGKPPIPPMIPSNRRKLTVDRVQLGDFGVSTILADRSNAQTMVGTPYYFSPELCMGRPYSGKSDMWSLGVMLFALLFNRLPFEASNYGALILRIVRQEGGDVVASLQKQLANAGTAMYSPILYKLCTWCLQKKDSSRPTAYDVLCHPACLQQCLDAGMELPPAVLQNQMAMSSLMRAHRVRVPTHVHESSASAAQEVLSAARQQQQQPTRDTKCKPSGGERTAEMNQPKMELGFGVLSSTVAVAASPIGPSSPTFATNNNDEEVLEFRRFSSQASSVAPLSTAQPQSGDSVGLVPETAPADRPLPQFRGGNNNPSHATANKARLLRGKTVPHRQDDASSNNKGPVFFRLPHKPPITIGVAPVLSTAKRAESNARSFANTSAPHIQQPERNHNAKEPVRKPGSAVGGGRPRAPLVCYDGVHLPAGQASLSGLRFLSSEDRQRQQERVRARDAEEVRALADNVAPSSDDEPPLTDGDDNSEMHESSPDDDLDRCGLLSVMAAAMLPPAPLRPKHKSPPPPKANLVRSPISRGMPLFPSDEREDVVPVHPPPISAKRQAPAKVATTVRSAGTVTGEQFSALVRAEDSGVKLAEPCCTGDVAQDADCCDNLYASAGAVNMQPSELKDMLLGAGHADYVEWCEAAAREREMLLMENWDDEGGRLNSTNGLQAAPFVVYEPGAMPLEAMMGGAPGTDGEGPNVTWKVFDAEQEVIEDGGTVMYAVETHPSSMNNTANSSTLRIPTQSDSRGSTVRIERTQNTWSPVPSLVLPARGGPSSYIPHLASTTTSLGAAPTPVCRTPMPTGRMAAYHMRQNSLLQSPSSRPPQTGRSIPDTGRSRASHALDDLDEIGDMLLRVSDEAEMLAGGPANLAEVLEVLTRGGAAINESDDEEGIADGDQSSTSNDVLMGSTVNLTNIIQLRLRGSVVVNPSPSSSAPTQSQTTSSASTAAPSEGQDVVLERLAALGVRDPRTQGTLLHLCLRLVFLEGQQRKLIRAMANPEAVLAAKALGV